MPKLTRKVAAALLTLGLALAGAFLLLPQHSSAGLINVAGGRGTPATGGGGGSGGLLESTATGMTADTWASLSTTNLTGITLPNLNGPVNSDTLENQTQMFYDPAHKVVHFIGCARGRTFGTDYECDTFSGNDAGGDVTYTLATNTWARNTSGGFNTSSHAYNRTALNPATGDIYHVETGQVSPPHLWKYAYGGTLTTINHPGGKFDFNPALAYFPEMDGGGGGLFMGLGGSDARDGGSATFDPEYCLRPDSTGTWTCHAMAQDALSYDDTFAAWSKVRHLIYFGGGSPDIGSTATPPVFTGPVFGPCCETALYTLSATGTLTHMENAPRAFGPFGASGKAAVNPCTGNLIEFSNDHTNKRIYSFDPSVTADGTWTTGSTHPLAVDTSDQLLAVFATVDEYNVIIVLTASPEAVWLYKPVGCS